MRILVINHRDVKNPRAGGLEELVQQTAKYWVAWGHHVDLLCAGYAGGRRDETIDGVRVIRGPNEYIFNWWAPWKARAIGPRQYDIILEYISKVPCFTPIFIRSTPTAVMIPHLFGKTAFAELPWLMAAYAYALEQPIPWVYRRCLFWALSKTTAEDLLGRGIPEERMEVIYPGFNEDLLKPDPRVQKTPNPTLIYIGRLKRYKRVDLIISATAKLQAQFPDIHLFIVGTGDYEKELRNQVASLGVEKSVEFCGFVSEARKKELMQMAWIGAQTSTIEGWGLGVIEAAACGTPTVASNSPGLRESVRDGETGILVPHGDVEALRNKVSGLFADTALRETMGTAARAWARQFSWKEMAHHSLQFLERAAGKSK
ncbi:MAG TPA: glycosyltransferase family 4 protein [Verrucomicrobiae bacterium]|nr:glycosyltransferase family 4 protein [Verrucomicrobiae bacterium]